MSFSLSSTDAHCITIDHPCVMSASYSSMRKCLTVGYAISEDTRSLLRLLVAETVAIKYYDTKGNRVLTVSYEIMRNSYEVNNADVTIENTSASYLYVNLRVLKTSIHA